MRTTGCQRWALGRASYRPPAERIDTRRHEVTTLAELDAKAFVVEHHYSRSYPAARFRFGLYERGELVGVAVFSQPINNASLDRFGCAREHATELGRFVLVDRVAGNGETWFLARCFDQLRADGVLGVLSCSDPVPRRRSDGTLVMPGHVGTIYQAHNGIYTGRTRAETLRLLPDGRVFHRRAQSKIRHLERGWRYAAGILEGYGATPFDGTAAWLDYWLERLTRPMRHPGNHRYVWALDRRTRRALPTPLAYPKNVDARAAA